MYLGHDVLGLLLAYALEEQSRVSSLEELVINNDVVCYYFFLMRPSVSWVENLPTGISLSGFAKTQGLPLCA